MTPPRRESAKTLRDQDGRIVCSCGCGKHPLPPRKTWFSNECVVAWREKNDPSYIRDQIWKRDHGICSLCECDSNADYFAWQKAVQEVNKLADRLIQRHRFNVVWVRGRWSFAPDTHSLNYREHHAYRKQLLAKYAPLGRWTPGRTSGWDADHIIPVVEGGGQCGLENYRTLCHPCHKKVTAELSRRRTKSKKQNTTQSP